MLMLNKRIKAKETEKKYVQFWTMMIIWLYFFSFLCVPVFDKMTFLACFKRRKKMKIMIKTDFFYTIIWNCSWNRNEAKERKMLFLRFFLWICLFDAVCSIAMTKSNVALKKKKIIITIQDFFLLLNAFLFWMQSNCEHYNNRKEKEMNKTTQEESHSEPFEWLMIFCVYFRIQKY